VSALVRGVGAETCPSVCRGAVLLLIRRLGGEGSLGTHYVFELKKAGGNLLMLR
jgi:hypothetical protein